jgi:signal transduction histidine kinase
MLLFPYRSANSKTRLTREDFLPGLRHPAALAIQCLPSSGWFGHVFGLGDSDMREDSAAPQPANRPGLAPHRFEPISARDSNSAISAFPANLESTADRTVEKPQPGRIPWMELVPEPGQSSAVSLASDQQRLAPQSTHSETSEVTIANPALSLCGLIHDARNLVTALDLYCDLLDTPGVLSASCHHYAGELRLIAGGSRRILEKLAATESTCASRGDARHNPLSHGDATSPVLTFPLSQAASAEKNAAPGILRPESVSNSEGESTALGHYAQGAPRLISQRRRPSSFQQISDTVESFSRGARWKPFVSPQPVTSLAEEVLANHNLLCALAGPGITVGLSLYGGKQPIAISSDDLTRILINLTKNAAEAMSHGGHIQIAVEEFSDRLCLSVSDTGSGLPESALEEIFTAGYTTHVDIQDPGRDSAGWSAPHRGLGLAIVRSIVAAAGGTVTASNRSDSDLQQSSLPCVENAAISGAIFSLNFPIHS